MRKTVTLPDWSKSLLGIGGILLFLVGLQIGLGILCRTSFAFSYGTIDPLGFLLTFLGAISMMGTGGALGWHSLASLQKSSSKPLLLPAAPLLIGLVSSVLVGGISSQTRTFFLLIFLPLLCLVAAFPSLLAISWFGDKQPINITWRQGTIAFTGSSFLGLIGLLAGWTLWSFGGLSWYLDSYVSLDLAQPQVVVALTGFLGFVILVVELVKPLITLPLLSPLTRREAFLLGAIAGAGFVPIATAVYVGLNPEAWLLALVLVTLGGAIHPLSSGLVTLGWYDLEEKPAGWPRWLAHYGLAVALQMVWNLGFLILVALNQFSFLGSSYFRSSGTDWLLWIGSWFVLLFVGAVAWWGGYSLTRPVEEAGVSEPALEPTSDPDRSIAIWAAACLVAIVPVGVISLYLLQ
jgi:hypothetical protein